MAPVIYFHSHTLYERKKSLSYLTSLFRHGPVNPSSLTFRDINLTETITNLIVDWKSNQRRSQEFLFVPLNPLKLGSTQIHI